jgi:hypothetical protein
MLPQCVSTVVYRDIFKSKVSFSSKVLTFTAHVTYLLLSDSAIRSRLEHSSGG